MPPARLGGRGCAGVRGIYNCYLSPGERGPPNAHVFALATPPPRSPVERVPRACPSRRSFCFAFHSTKVD